MLSRSRRTFFKESNLLLCALCVSAVNVSLAGPLTPPPGPITPTNKPLSEVEPRTAINATNTPGDADSVFRITQPGSYYLTATITGESAKHGIEIAADGVTIDLNGFSLLGVAGTLDGITTAGVPRARIQIRNGSIGAFATGGIDLEGSGHRVETCHVRFCGTYGVRIDSGAIVGCNAGANFGAGFRGDTAVVFEQCVAESNTQGFLTGPSSVLRGCIARANAEDGFGVFLTGSVSFENCTADSNSGNGFRGFGANTYSNCAARNNQGAGFQLGQDGACVTNCHASNNGGSGIGANVATIIGCYSHGNTFAGISVLAGVVSGCKASSNGTDGIVVSSQSHVVGNECSGNGAGGGDGAGILASQAGNRIENNTCSNNDRGIEISGNRNRIDGNSCIDNQVSFDINGTDNLVIRNTATGGTPNYSIVAGNSVAPRISVTDSDGWAGIANANHPWANFGH